MLSWLQDIFMNDFTYPIVTPTKWQFVILRNYGQVSNKKLGEVLSCDTATIYKEAKRLGINKIKFNKIWLDKSYLTIIRNNWSVLPNSQIMDLLDMSKDRFEFELKENDFLFVKLGEKEDLEEVKYVPLTKEQIDETNKIRNIVNNIFINNYIAPFSFKYNLPKNKIYNEHLNIVYPYNALFGDPLISSYKLVSEDELKALSIVGINGIWLQGLLSKLTYYPFSKREDESYKIRIKNLNKFISLAKKYNIGVYLYLNEPRSIKVTDLKEEYSYLSGRKEGNEVSLCISQKEVQDYLYSATKSLVDNVPELEGIITITSSENLTHCKHILGSDCPKCKDYKPYELAVLINNIMSSAIRNSKTKLIANLWGWAPYCGYTNEDVKNGIKALEKDITIMSVSEFGTHKDKHIGEYSISNGEPCEESKYIFELAKSLNRKVMSKVQVNNSWEIATISYIPTFDLIINHLNELKKLGVNDFMSSWTLGGYPSISQYIFNILNNNKDISSFYDEIFKENSSIIKKAVKEFSNAFKNFPFDINTLYFSPIHLGPVNPIFDTKKIHKASMVTFPYNDINSWSSDLNNSIKCFKLLLAGWENGLKTLSKVKKANKFTKELIDNAYAVYYIYSSCLNQFEYYSSKIDFNEFKNKEINNTKKLYLLAAKNSTIGFEASNQYMFTQNYFIEKLISLLN